MIILMFTLLGMIKMYYKTNDENAVKTFLDFMESRNKFKQACEDFASEYNAKPIVLQDSDSIYLSGIVFNDKSKVNVHVWTKPENQYKMQQLRVKATKAAFRQEHSDEVEKYKQLKDKYFSEFNLKHGRYLSKEPVYNALGINSGSLFFHSLDLFYVNGFLYVDTGVKLELQEILGSEFIDAKREFNRGQK